MSAKAHYDQHLSHFYSWMTGDFTRQLQKQEGFFREQRISPSSTGVALDLGAGHGIHTVTLARLGFRVVAVDFSKPLLDELVVNSKGFPVTPVEADIRDVLLLGGHQPELITCCGDTLAHLDSWDEVNRLLQDCHTVLQPGGLLVLSFRDYSIPLQGANRFIPVKSDPDRILTCILEYLDDKLLVTDLLHEKINGNWEQKVSSYEKLRLSTSRIAELVTTCGFSVEYMGTVDRMTGITACKA